MSDLTTLKFIAEKFNLDLNRPSPIEIANVGRGDLANWLHELDFKVGVEVGVAEGKYSRTLAIANPQMKLYGVDPWKNYSGYVSYQNQEVFDKLHQEALGRLNHLPNYEFMDLFSTDAVKNFNDESLDFVYIDANHQDPYISEDITNWSKKIKPGGIIAGHDYIRLKKERCDVIDAVNNFTKRNNIAPWFILGLNAKIPGLIRDPSRSWMWVK